MAQKPTIPTEDTLQFLQEKFNGDVTELTLLSGGDWSQAYSFIHDHKKYVLRWCHSSETFEKDATASTFSSEAMPVPKVIDAGKQFDTYFAITEFAQGQFIDKLKAAEVQNLLPALLNLFDALRNVDLSHTMGYGGWDKNGIGSEKSWRAYLLGVKGSDDVEHFTKGWYTDLANSSIGIKVFDELYAQFEPLVEKCPEVREMIHSDLLNYNLLTADNHISGVIDWQCALYGDSLYDVAWFIFYEPWYPEFGAVQLGQKLLAHFESGADSTNLRARLLCYQLHIGLGSIVYNTFRKNWPALQEVSDYTLKVLQQATTS